MTRRSDRLRGCEAPCPARGPRHIDRRAFVQRVLTLAVGIPAAAALAGCGDHDASMGGQMESMPGWMMGQRGSRDALMQDMRVIGDLLTDHDEIQRSVTDVPGGIRSLTTSANDHVAEWIQTHVWAMKQRIHDGDAIHQMDPLFREIFKHHTAISMEIQNTGHGVQVTETSHEAQVTLLIRQHARRAISEFVAEGMPRAMQPTPLPRGYDDA